MSLKNKYTGLTAVEMGQKHDPISQIKEAAREARMEYENTLLKEVVAISVNEMIGLVESYGVIQKEMRQMMEKHISDTKAQLDELERLITNPSEITQRGA